MNRNQARLRKQLAKDGNVEVQVPSGGYHNHEKGIFHTRRIEGGHQTRLSHTGSPKVGNPGKPDALKGPSLAEQREMFSGK